MTGRGLQVGVCLPQFTTDGKVTVAAAKAAEDDGYDVVSLFDHLRPLGGPPDRPILECLTMLTAVAASTSRLRVLPLVLRAPLRPAGTVASAFRTLSMLAPHRVICGVGAGDRLNEAEDLSVGLPTLSAEARRESVRAVVAAVRATSPEVPVWLGGTGPSMRTMAAQIADGWNMWGVPAGVVLPAVRELRRSAGEAGRAAPVVSWGGQVILATSDTDAENRLQTWGGNRRTDELAGVIRGNSATVAQQLHDLAAAGVSVLLLSFVGGDAATMRRDFAREVLPVVRRTAPI